MFGDVARGLSVVGRAMAFRCSRDHLVFLLLSGVALRASSLPLRADVQGGCPREPYGIAAGLFSWSPRRFDSDGLRPRRC